MSEHSFPKEQAVLVAYFWPSHELTEVIVTLERAFGCVCRSQRLPRQRSPLRIRSQRCGSLQ